MRQKQWLQQHQQLKKKLPVAVGHRRWSSAPLRQHRLKDDEATTCIVCYGSDGACEFEACFCFGPGPWYSARSEDKPWRLPLVGRDGVWKRPLGFAWLPKAHRAGPREVSHCLSSLLFVAEHLDGQSLGHCVACLQAGHRFFDFAMAQRWRSPEGFVGLHFRRMAAPPFACERLRGCPFQCQRPGYAQDPGTWVRPRPACSRAAGNSGPNCTRVVT
jgi:hypothetical protein